MGMRHENHCVGCPPEMGCMRSICRNWNATVYFCDKCGAIEEPENLFLYETKNADYDYCEDCFIEETLKNATRTSEVRCED